MVGKRRRSRREGEAGRVGVEDAVRLVAYVDELVAVGAGIEQQPARVVVAGLGAPPGEAVDDGVGIGKRAAVVGREVEVVRAESLRVDVAGGEPHGFEARLGARHEEHPEAVGVVFVSVKPSMVEVPIGEELLPNARSPEVLTNVRLGAHVDFEEPPEALAVRRLDGDEGVRVQRQVKRVVAGGTHFDGAPESRLVAKGIAEGPAKRPVARLGGEPEGEQDLGERRLVVDRLEANAAILLAPIGGRLRTAPEVGVQFAVAVDTERVGHRLADAFLVTGAREELVVREALQTMEERTLVAVAAGDGEKLARRDDAVLVGELQNEPIIVLNLDVARPRRREAVALILPADPSLWERLSVGV